jgi:hypothetical protein
MVVLDRVGRAGVSLPLAPGLMGRRMVILFCKSRRW